MTMVMKMLGRKIAATVINRKKVGIDSMISNKREITISIHDPK